MSPNGRTHEILWRKYIWLAFAGMAFAVVVGEWHVVSAILPGYYLGLWVDPDMDMPRNWTSAKMRWRRTWLFAWMVLWWNAYGLVFRLLGGHRSFWSHMPGLSTAGRLVWMSVPFIGMVYLLGGRPGVTWFIQPTMGELALGLFIGLSISDLVHSLADAGVLR